MAQQRPHARWPTLPRPGPKPHGVDARDTTTASYMTSLLARLGQLESRRGASTLWTSGKRKRFVGSQWTCAECRARRAVRQRRGYSDDGLRLAGDLSFFPEKNVEEEATKERREPQTRRRKSAWGLTDPETRQNAGAAGTSRSSNAFFDQHGPADSEKSTLQPRDEEQEQVILWEQFESDEAGDSTKDAPASRHAVDDSAQNELRPIEQSTLLNIDYKEELSKALSGGEADLLTRCLFAASQANDLDFLRSLSAETFSSIILLLQPSNFIARLASAHIELSSALVKKFGIVPMRQVAFEYNHVLRQVLGIRRSAGIPHSLADYAVLLRSARDLGNQKMGFVVWNALLTDGHVPTTECYNYYMSTVIWNGIHSAGSRQKLRVVPFNMLARKERPPKSRFRNWSAGPEGIRSMAMRIFNEMLASGVAADEESFRLLMTASAREGDMATVKSLLAKVWQIDVDTLLAGGDEATITPRSIPENSPLRPTPDLLFTIAHAFGINNDVPAAIRVVDFVARSYDLTISPDVWGQLFEWTFVLATRRHGKAKEDSNMGQLPAESVIKLWQTMTGAPYFIQPTFGMYNQLMKNLAQRSWTLKMYEKMFEAENLYWEQLADTRSRRHQLQAAIAHSEDIPPTTSLEEMRREWEYGDLIRQRNRFWMKRWVRLLLRSYVDWSRVDFKGQSYACELPRLLWEWWGFAPSIVRYEIPTGYVEMEFRSHGEIVHVAKERLRYEHHVRAVLGKAQRYVGDKWVRGQEPRPTRRLQKELASDDPGSDGAG